MVSHAFKQISALLVLLLDKYSRQRDARQQFLAAQIEILRRRLKVDHVKLSPEERRELMTLGSRFDHQIDECLLVVKPRTYRGWLRDAAAGRESKKVGRNRDYNRLES